MPIPESNEYVPPLPEPVGEPSQHQFPRDEEVLHGNAVGSAPLLPNDLNRLKDI